MTHSLKSDGKVYTSMNKHLGTVKPDGKVYNPMNKHLGTVKPDGKVYNSVNKHIENVSNIKLKIKTSAFFNSSILVAAYHFIIKPIF